MKTKVSIVVPVYNAEKYLEQCIESIIGQDVGLGSIELVLVNDGSKDKSGKICERYAARFASNIVYLDQKNAGVSEARNAGVRAATGAFIGFVDADDYISSNTVSSVLTYFDDAPSSVDVAVIRVMQFGYYSAERSINLKFNEGTRTIDLEHAEWQDVYARVAPAFFRSDTAKRHYFHKEIGIYEDTRFMAEVLSENMKLGVVMGGVYYNRIHAGDVNASITTGAAKEKRFYLDSPEKVSLYLLAKFKGKKKYPPLYFQFVALYEMRWRMFHNPHNPQEVLSKSEYSTYKKVNDSILRLVSDEAIMQFEMYSLSQRMYLLNLKYGRDVAKAAVLNSDNRLMWKGTALADYNRDLLVKITDVLFLRNEILLEGHFSVPLVDKVQVYPSVNGGDRSDLMTLRASPTTKQDTEPLLYNSDTAHGDSFVITLPLNADQVQSLDFMLVVNNKTTLIERATLPATYRYGVSYRGDYSFGKKIGGILLYPINNRKVIRRAMAGVRYLLELVRRVLRKVKRICIRMIKTLR